MMDIMNTRRKRNSNGKTRKTRIFIYSHDKSICEVNHRPTLCHDDICKQAGDLVKIIIQRVVEPLLAGRKIRTKRLIRV